MKVKLSEILEIGEAGQFAINSSFLKWFRLDMKIKTAYRVGKLIKKLESELGNFSTQREMLIKKFGKEDRETLINGQGSWIVKPKSTKEGELGANGLPAEEDNPKYAEYIKALGELLVVETEIDFEPIPLAEFDTVKLSGMDMAVINKFVAE